MISDYLNALVMALALALLAGCGGGSDNGNPDVPPSAVISSDCTGPICEFNADESVPGTHPIVEYQWKLMPPNGGDPIELSGSQITHDFFDVAEAFDSIGFELTVTNSEGFSDTRSSSRTLQEAVLIDIDVDCEGLICHFDGTNTRYFTAEQPTRPTFIWTLPGGHEYPLAEFSHTFQEAGEIEVSLMVGGDGLPSTISSDKIQFTDDGIPAAGTRTAIRKAHHVLFWTMDAQESLHQAFRGAIPHIEAVGPELSASIPCDAGGTVALQRWFDQAEPGVIDSSEETFDSVFVNYDRCRWSAGPTVRTMDESEHMQTNAKLITHSPDFALASTLFGGATVVDGSRSIVALGSYSLIDSVDGSQEAHADLRFFHNSTIGDPFDEDYPWRSNVHSRAKANYQPEDHSLSGYAVDHGSWIWQMERYIDEDDSLDWVELTVEVDELAGPARWELVNNELRLTAGALKITEEHVIERDESGTISISELLHEAVIRPASTNALMEVEVTGGRDIDAGTFTIDQTALVHRMP